jgi:hypothetical protein
MGTRTCIVTYCFDVFSASRAFSISSSRFIRMSRLALWSAIACSNVTDMCSQALVGLLSDIRSSGLARRELQARVDADAGGGGEGGGRHDEDRDCTRYEERAPARAARCSRARARSAARPSGVKATIFRGGIVGSLKCWIYMAALRPDLINGGTCHFCHF